VNALAEEKPMKPDQNIPASIVPIHLLLVEDNPGDARLVYEMLNNQLHIKLEVADCLAACMLRLDQGGIDLVLLDLGLSDSQGLDTLTSVTNSHSELSVVALTGLDDDALALRTVQAGGQDYLTKNTVTPEILRRTIRHAFERKRVELQIKAALGSLQKSEENFRRSLEDSPLGMRIATAKGETIYANKALLDIYGYESIDEFNGIPIKKRYTPQSHAEFLMRKKDREQGNFGPSEYEINIVRKNGGIRHLMVLRNEILWNCIKQFQVIYQDITERKLIEEALRESEGVFNQFLAASPVLVYIKNEKHEFNKLSKSFEDLFGKPISELIGRDLYELLPQELAKVVFEDDLKVLKGGFSVNAEERLNDKVFSSTKFPIHRESGKPDYLGGFSVDITERKRAEETIRASLAEKEVLLKEVHHRVKNNLMTIIGLIKMQEAKADNKMFNSLLLELEGRVRAMAMVHESLHKSANLAHVNLQNYIETLGAHICAQFGTDRELRFSVQSAGVDVGLDIAVPCGLILNELITNACKHAFPAGQPGEIRISFQEHTGVKFYTQPEESGTALRRDRSRPVPTNNPGTARRAPTYELTVADNGVGLPAGLDWEKAETLGLRLVKMLSQQLNGSIELDRSSGTVFSLQFPVPEKKH
jgi:PAS domain S-box-containing protein